MNYVYTLQSVSHPDQFYTGLCKDIESRLAAHNAASRPTHPSSNPGGSFHATISNVPEAAVAFELYLKSGSGRAFANKHLR